MLNHAARHNSVTSSGAFQPRAVRLLVCAGVCAALCWAVVAQQWVAILGVACLGILGALVALRKWRACLALFTLVLVIPTCLTISIWSVNGSLLVHASLARYATIGAAGIAGVVLMAWGRKKKLEGFDVAWLVVALLVAISCFYSIDPSASIGRGIPLVAWCFCLYALITTMTRVEGGPLAVLDVLLAGIGLFLLIGAYLAFTRPDLVFAAGRFTSAFRSASAVGEVCCILLPVTLWAAVHHPARVSRLLYSGLVLIVSGSLLASQVRNGIGAVIGGLTVTFLVKRRRHLAGEAPLLAAILAVFVAAGSFCYMPLSKTDFFQRYISRGGTLETATGRFILWGQSLRQIQKHPLMGFGYGTESVAIFSTSLPSYLRESSHQLSRYQEYLPFLKLNALEGLHAHNTLLGVLVELGATGLVAYVAVLVFAFRGIMRVRPCDIVPPCRTLPAFLVGALSAGLLNSIFESDLLSPGGIGFALFWLIVAVSEAVRRRRALSPSHLGPMPTVHTLH